MQQELELSRQITAILGGMTDAFFLLDNAMVIRYCNTTAQTAFNKDKDELLGRPFFDAFSVLRGGIFEESIKLAHSEKAQRSFEAHVQEGPSETWFSVTLFPYESGMAVHLRDITQRKRDEESLREKESLLGVILDTSPAAIAMTVNRIVKWVNDSWVRTFDFRDKNEAVGLDAKTLYPDEENSNRVGELYQRLADGKIASTEVVMKRKNGSLFEAVVYLKAVDPKDLSKGVVSTILDISEGKEAQRQIDVGQRKLEQALNGAELGWWSHNLAANIVHRNENYAKMLGFSPNEIEATPEGWTKLVHPEDRDRVLKAFDDHVTGKTPRYESEYRMRTKDGEWKWVLDRGKVIDRDTRNQPLIAAGTILDVSHSKKLEQERIEMQGKMHQAQKLESLSVMAGGIAHQFNNLLQIVLGNLELLQMQIRWSPRLATYVEGAFKAARRAAKLSGLMLNYTGQSLYMCKDVDINDIVVRSEPLFSSMVPKGVRFILERGEVKHSVSGDAALIEQVIMSLVTNAAEAVGKGPGEIRLVTGEMDCDQAYLATTRPELDPKPGRFVFVEVSDTGHGIDAAGLERIFDPFFTTKFMGRGLGMAAVLGIVRAHKGGIRIDSEVGRGTAVRVLFPARADLNESQYAATDSLAEETLSKFSAKSSRKVLMVDDDEIVLQLGADLLTALGYDGLTASSGEEAIMLCTQPDNAIGCVILDISMPRMDGVQVLRELKRQRPDLKIIISSGFPEPETRLIIGDIQVEGFLTKPYDIETFKTVLEEAQEKR